MSGINYGQAFNNSLVPLTPSNHIMCCSGIEVTSQKAPYTDPAHIAERMMFFLCSYWAGKEPEQDSGSSQWDFLIAANFSGVIRVSEHNTTGNGYPAVRIRWFASYHPDHPKSSKLAVVGNRGTGPDGKYMEIQEGTVKEEISVGRLVHTNIDMEYGDCMNHRQTIFLARWFEFRDDPAAIILSPQLVYDGKIGNSQGVGTPRACSKCRGMAPGGEFRVNIYNGREKPTLCTACQAYRRHREPQRKSRAKTEKAVVQNGNANDASQSTDANQVVDNSQLISGNQAFDNSQVDYNNQVFDNSQVVGNHLVLGYAQGVNGNLHFDSFQGFDNAQLVDNSQAIDSRQSGEKRLFSDPDEYIDPSLYSHGGQAANDDQAFDFSWLADGSQATDEGVSSAAAYNPSTANDASMKLISDEEALSQTFPVEDHDDLYRAD